MGISGWAEDNPEMLKFRLLFQNELAHSTIIARRQKLKDRFFYDYRGPEDYGLWLKLLFDNE